MQKLWDAVDRYNKGDGLKEPWLDDDIEHLAELLIQIIHRIGAAPSGGSNASCSAL